MLLALFAGCARATIMPPGEPEKAIGPPLVRLPQLETLEYQISWWGLPVGRATLTSSEISPSGLMTLTFEAHSNPSLALFYPVRVKLTSVVDPATLRPKRFEGYVKRRWKIHQSVITFDFEKKIATHILPDEEPRAVAVAPETQDGVSLLYYVRTLSVQLGKEIPLRVAADGKNWDLKGQVVRAHVVRVGALGNRPALQGEVELAYPVPLFHGANARVWFSADEERIPLLAKISSRIGPVTAVLTGRTLGNNKS